MRGSLDTCIAAPGRVVAKVAKPAKVANGFLRSDFDLANAVSDLKNSQGDQGPFEIRPGAGIVHGEVAVATCACTVRCVH